MIAKAWSVPCCRRNKTSVLINFERNSLLCKRVYLLHSKHHCSSIAARDLPSWRRHLKLLLGRLAGWLQTPGGGQHRASPYCCSAKKNTITPERQLQVSLAASPSIIWLARAAAAAARLAASSCAAAGFQIYKLGFFQLQFRKSVDLLEYKPTYQKRLKSYPYLKLNLLKNLIHLPALQELPVIHKLRRSLHQLWSNHCSSKISGPTSLT